MQQGVMRKRSVLSERGTRACGVEQPCAGAFRGYGTWKLLGMVAGSQLAHSRRPNMKLI